MRGSIDDSDGADIEWVQLQGPARTIEGPEPRSTSRFVSLVVASALILGAAGIASLLWLTAGDRRADGDEDAALTDSADEVGDDEIVIRASMAETDAISPREQALLGQAAGTALLITRHDGGSPFMAVLDERGRLSVEGELAGMRRFAVDSSSTWMAAVSENPALPGTETLWAGPIDGELTPVGVEVRGFAWHDTDPGRLAFVTAGSGAVSPQLVELELLGARPRTRQIGPVEGWLQMWGEWGYVVRSSRTGLGFTLLDADASAVTDSTYRGSAAGWVEGIGLLATPWGSRGMPVILDPKSGEPSRAPWLAEFQHVWASAQSTRSGSASLVATQVTNFDDRLHEVVIADPIAGDGGEILHRISAVGATAALRWSPDGESLFFVREDHRTRTELVIYDRASNSHTAIALPGLRAEDHWTRAVALGN